MKKMIIKIATAILTMMMVFGLSPATAEAYSSYCQHPGCNNKTVSGSNYCSKHKCKKSGCGKEEKSSYDGYCSSNHKNSCTSKSTSKNSSYSSYSSKKNTSSSSKKNSSSKKVEMPDCDDYEDYDDFMDDWDGCMPDGSDAEDYWEEW